LPFVGGKGKKEEVLHREGRKTWEESIIHEEKEGGSFIRLSKKRKKGGGKPFNGKRYLGGRVALRREKGGKPHQFGRRSHRKKKRSEFLFGRGGAGF